MAEMSTPEVSRNHIKGIKLFLVMSAITIATFLMLLDTSIVSTAIPKITDEFQSLNDVGWYGSSYLLSYSVMQLLSGKLYNKFSTKWTYLVLFGIFELGSLLCGVAKSSTVLTVARAVAGMGGAGLINGAMTIIGTTTPLHKQPTLIGVLMGIAEMGVVCGPLVGGAFTTRVTWRWCFYINLPIGAVVALYLIFVPIPDQIDKPEPTAVLKNAIKELDLPGFALVSGAAIQLLLGLYYGNIHGWGSVTVIGLLCGSIANFFVWIFWNWKIGDDSLVPLSIASRRPVWASSLTAMFIMTTQIITAYYLPIYFQAVRGNSALMSGVNILPTIIGQVFGAVLGGALMQQVGFAIPFGLVGALLATVGTGLFVLFTPTTSTGRLVGFEIIQGIGRGLAVQTPLVSIQAHSLPSEISIGTSLLMFTQTLGNSVFLTVSNTIFNAALRETIPKYAPSVNPDEIILLGATEFRTVLTSDQLSSVLYAYSKSIAYAFYVAIGTGGLAFFSCMLMGWVDTRKKNTVPRPLEESQTPQVEV